MNIHIVCPEHRSDWIIARLVRHLMKGNGWTASKKPDTKADVNVFFPYCQWRFTKFRKTLTAGWMTHREDESVEGGAKRRRWDFTAPELNLRVSPSLLYVRELRQYGPTAHIPHPVELKKFVIAPRTKHDKPVIGLAGKVYPGGRKGEHLIKRLYEDYHRHWKVRAAGQGWPVPTKHYPWEHLQEFFQGLDVFLCTSLVEGGPVTVLEALACGKPVVVPEHVGFIDELPKIIGIHRYVRDDYDSMVGAIKGAILMSESPKSLRAIAAEYTIPRWCRRWRRAIGTIT